MSDCHIILEFPGLAQSTMLLAMWDLSDVDGSPTDGLYMILRTTKEMSARSKKRKPNQAAPCKKNSEKYPED